MPETLELVRAEIDSLLARGASDRRSPMHTPVVATGADELRVMVLRAWDRDRRTLRFHTDARSPKAAAIGDSAPAGALFYDAAAKVQLRCGGTGRIERDGPIADAAWAAADAYARRCYLIEPGPGAPRDTPGSGLPADLEGVRPDLARTEAGRANFAVLLVAVERFDWLHLAHTGHLRALFDSDGGRWITP